jgi:hypothetical protein
MIGGHFPRIVCRHPAKLHLVTWLTSQKHSMASATACCSKPTARAPAAGPQQSRSQHTGAVVAALRPTCLPQRRSGPCSSGAAAATTRRRRRGATPTQALFGGLGSVFKNDPAERTRKQYQDRVNQINALEPDMERLSDEQLRQLTQSLRQRAQGGEALDNLLVEAFAVSSRNRARFCAADHRCDKAAQRCQGPCLAVHPTLIRQMRTGCLRTGSPFLPVMNPPPPPTTTHTHTHTPPSPRAACARGVAPRAGPAPL